MQDLVDHEETGVHFDNSVKMKAFKVKMGCVCACACETYFE